MPEMATLDLFFNKVERPASLSTAEQQKCKSSSDNNEKSHKDASRKRGRSCDFTASTKRLHSKRRKPLDSNLNVSESAVEVDATQGVVSNCASCSQIEAQDLSAISIPPPTVEISYEEFLTAKGIAHVETSLGSSEDADADADSATEAETSHVNMSLKHGELSNERTVKCPKKGEKTHDEEEEECEENILSDNSEVSSKDIRSFFSKADKVIPQTVTAVTLVKVKADVHCHHSKQRNMSSKCAEGRIKTGNDLARRQRAAIVITDDDLDIEVIDITSRNDEDCQVDCSLEDSAVENVATEPTTENDVLDAKHEDSSSVCNEVFVVDADSSSESAVQRDSVNIGSDKPARKSAVSARKLRLRTAKISEASFKAETTHHSKETEVHNTNISCDSSVPQIHKAEGSGERDEVILVGEKDAQADDDDNCPASAAGDAGTADRQSRDVKLATWLRHPVQVRYWHIVSVQIRLSLRTILVLGCWVLGDVQHCNLLLGAIFSL